MVFLQGAKREKKPTTIENKSLQPEQEVLQQIRLLYVTRDQFAEGKKGIAREFFFMIYLFLERRREEEGQKH